MTRSKIVLGATASITAGGILARIIGLLSALVLTRHLGPIPYGTLALVLSLLQLASTLALFGRELGYARFSLLGEQRDRIAVESFLWRSVLLSSFAAAILFGAGWIVMLPASFRADRTIGVMLAVLIFLSPAISMATVRNRVGGKYYRIALASALSAFAGAAVSILWATMVAPTVWALLVGLLATSSLNLAALSVPPLRQLSHRSGAPRALRSQATRLGLVNVVTAPLYWIMMSVDRWFLQLYAGTSEVGIYAFAAQFGLLAAMLNNAIISTWPTEAGRTFDQRGESSLPSLAADATALMTALLIAWVGICAGMGDALRLIASPEFHPGVRVIPWIALGTFFYGLVWIFSASLFVKARMRYLAIAWLGGGLVSVLAYSTLAAPYGALGVAIGQAAGFATSAAITWIFSHRVLALPLPYLRLVSGFSAAVLSAFVMSPEWATNPWVSLAAKFPCGIVSATVILAVTSPELFGRIFQFITTIWRHRHTQ